MRYKEEGPLALAQAVLGAGAAVKSSVRFEVEPYQSSHHRPSDGRTSLRY